MAGEAAASKRRLSNNCKDSVLVAELDDVQNDEVAGLRGDGVSTVAVVGGAHQCVPVSRQRASLQEELSYCALLEAAGTLDGMSDARRGAPRTLVTGYSSPFFGIPYASRRPRHEDTLRLPTLADTHKYDQPRRQAKADVRLK